LICLISLTILYFNRGLSFTVISPFLFFPIFLTIVFLFLNLPPRTVSPTSNTVASGTTVSAPTPTRSGYTFLYWRDGTTSFNYANQINVGGSWTVTSNITFYAFWQVASVAPTTPTGVSVSGSGVVSWNAVSGADYYEVLNYTDRTGSPSNTTNRLGPYNTIVYTTSLQLGSNEGYSSPNNWARAQVRAWNNAGQVSTYSSWVPSASTYT
jgi:predicted secreted protein